MLPQLVAYARDHGLVAEPGFAPKVVRWVVQFDPAGKYLGPLDLGGPKDPGRAFARCPELSQPEMKRGGAGCRHFLVDGLDVVALYADDPEDAKLRAKHAYFVNLLRLAAPSLPILAPIADALEDLSNLADLRARLQAGKARPTERATLAILDDASASFPVDSDAWHEWWRDFRKGLARDDDPSGDAVLARCLATGELVAPAPTHPKIAGLSDVGGLAMGDVLASFKQESFCSYGLEQAANAPVSEANAAAYRAALNHLIKTQSERFAHTKVVYWYRHALQPDEDPLVSFFRGSDEDRETAATDRAHDLLASPKTGRLAYAGNNEYHVATLSGASGRVMLRDWLEGPLSELSGHLEEWWRHLAITRQDGMSLAPSPPLWRLLSALVRDPKELPPTLEAHLVRAALQGTPIPRIAMSLALARVKNDIVTDKLIPYPRMALLRAFHVRHGDLFMQPYLNEDHPEAAYHCGRLLALLAAVQYRALGDVGAGVIQRYYAAASTTPALVLGRLTRNAHFHLDKLDRGLANWHEGRIAEVWGRIKDSVPPTLSLEKQSLFALGYYQQIAFDRHRTKGSGAAGAPTAQTDSQETENA